MLTPIDIHNKEFKRSFRGYNEDEIDEFLDQVVNDYEILYRENRQLKEQLANSQKQNEQYERQEKTLQDTLLVAQKTADEVMSAARKNAEELKENTKRECDNLRQQAEMEAARRIEVAKNQVNQIVAEYERLVREKNNFLTRIRTALEAELAILVETTEALPNPDAEVADNAEQPAKEEAVDNAVATEAEAENTDESEEATALIEKVKIEE